MGTLFCIIMIIVIVSIEYPNWSRKWHFQHDAPTSEPDFDAMQKDIDAGMATNEWQQNFIDGKYRKPIEKK